MKKLLWIIACCVLLTGAAPNAGLASTPPPAKEAAASAAPASVAAGLVNLNDATAEQLELLPGIGPSRSSAIVAYRKTHPFKRVEELMRVKGIGKKSFARLRPLLSLSGATTLKERPRRAS